jgi:putative iron-only hydrogenase system regulator
MIAAGRPVCYNHNATENRRSTMETRVAVISIIVTQSDKVEMLNDLLHEYSVYIIGRMGIPYKEKGISIISIAIDAPMDKINSLTGALGRLDGINAKVTYAKV